MITRLENGTLLFENKPRVAGYAAVVGKKESEGPLGAQFDKVIFECRGEDDTYEAAESRLQREAARLAMEKAQLGAKDIDCIFAGDLLNQCVGSSFGLMGFGAPFLGQYGACSTMAQSLLMGAVFVESGAANHALCVTSSHFCAAERQYRFPLEYGAVRTPTAQWTVTGAGGCVLGKTGTAITVSAATPGKIIDLSITDANNMGAAMAPAMGIIEPYPIGKGRLLHQKSKRKELFRSGKFLKYEVPYGKTKKINQRGNNNYIRRAGCAAAATAH